VRVTHSTDPSAGLAPRHFSRLLGFRHIQAADGESLVEADPTPDHCNQHGIVHGGFLAALLDTTTGWAVHTKLPAGTAAPHVHLSIQYVRAAVPGTTLVCRGRAISAGRRSGATEAEITQDGVVVARAVGTHAVLAPR
jgi:acyl-CoA thioesterase